MEAAFVNCYMNTEVDSDTMIADFEQYADIDTSSDCAAINRDMYVDYENPINTPMQICRKLSR